MLCVRKGGNHTGITISDSKKKQGEDKHQLDKMVSRVSTPTHLISHGDAFCVSAEAKRAAL